MPARALCVAIALVPLALGACGGQQDATVRVVADTLASGQVAVSNPDRGLWEEGDAWRVQEDLRIGALESDGPDNFGQIRSIAVDGAGRILVLEGQTDELRVFGPDGTHERTIGRSGEGPGEFSGALRVDVSDDGDIWVIDPQNTRLTRFDPLGAVVESHPFGGGFVTLPWRGGFDREGRYRSPIVHFDPDFTVRIAVLDVGVSPPDTVDVLDMPTDPVERLAWRIESEGRTRVAASVPFQGRIDWALTRSGTIWALLTDQYRLYELSAEGDTLRTTTMPTTPLPVPAADREEAIKRYEWFTQQGGRIDPSMIPSEKPEIGWLFVDDLDHVWVGRVGEGSGTTSFDVFNAEAHYLGRVDIGVPIAATPSPVVRDGQLYAVTLDDFDVPFVVRARLERP